MPHLNEIDSFRNIWDLEAGNTIRLLEALPTDQYDFRPDPKGRSIGELAWHLAELDGYTSIGIVQGNFDFKGVVPGMERPRKVAELAPGYRRVHQEASARLRDLPNERLDETLQFFDGRPMPIRQILWGGLLYHYIHHRGQLVLMCRLAGGVPPGIYGPTREEMQAMREQMAGAKA